MKHILIIFTLWLSIIPIANADYERNKPQAVEKVIFAEIDTVKHITEHELIQDKNQGWKVFGGALVGGAIGNQFGRGSGRDIATILGALIGGSMANDKHPNYQEKSLHLVELMLTTEHDEQFMIIQDYDAKMIFNRGDTVRMIYLANGSVRIDKQM